MMNNSVEPAGLRPKLPVLYKLNNKNKVMKWEIEMFGPDDGAFYTTTRFGEVGGEIQTQTTIIHKGKAGRSTESQMVLEATSKWSKKINRDAYSTSVEPGARTIRPMLASAFAKAKATKTRGKGYRMPFPCYVQPKYDGIRCLAHIVRDDAGIRLVMESRTGVAFANFDHIRDALLSYQPLRQSFLAGNTIYLDGELYTDSLTFEQINGAARITAGKATSEDLDNIEKIQYHIYDIYIPKLPLLTYTQRMARMYFIAHPPIPEFADTVVCVATETAESVEDIKRLHDGYVKAGFEGIMLRDPEGTYEVDKRSAYLQKYKEFMEEEFAIVGFHDGDALETGLVIWECETLAGLRFSARPRGTHAHRRELFASAKEYVGRYLTVIFQEYSADGVPRFPVGKSVREDI
jgi:ATP dependent DNA ligase domain/DNA ligase OB-like domain